MAPLKNRGFKMVCKKKILSINKETAKMITETIRMIKSRKAKEHLLRMQRNLAIQRIMLNENN